MASEVELWAERREKYNIVDTRERCLTCKTGIIDPDTHTCFICGQTYKLVRTITPEYRQRIIEASRKNDVPLDGRRVPRLPGEEL